MRAEFLEERVSFNNAVRGDLVECRFCDFSVSQCALRVSVVRILWTRPTTETQSVSQRHRERLLKQGTSVTLPPPPACAR